MGLLEMLGGSAGGPPPPGRDFRPFQLPARHEVLDAPLEYPGGLPEGLAQIHLAMGCFWGAEELYWQVPGVVTTAVGYQGGTTPNPTYDEVCTGRTGHTETALVVYDPQQVQVDDLLAAFWENHDPTQGDRQGNDIGSQYRSAVFCSPDAADTVRATRDRYQGVLDQQHLGRITTQIETDPVPFYYAEPEHQQYLHKVPYGYRCHANTGISYPRG